MSNFFENLNANFMNMSRTVSQKVKNSSDASKLMNEITTENKSIQANLTAIGKLYYDICKDEPDEAFREMVEAITRSEQRIIELQESIKIIRAREPELVHVPPEQNTFQQQMKPSMMVCLGCGNTYPEGTGFCSVCGQKLVPQYQNAAAAASAPAQTADDVQIKPEVSESEEEVIVEAEIILEGAEEIDTASSADEQSRPESESAQFCPYCGTKLSIEGQKFCGKCGQLVDCETK